MSAPSPLHAANLAAQDERIRHAFTFLPELTDSLVAVVAQPDRHFLYLNPAGRALLGLATDESVTTRTLTQFIAEQTLAPAAEAALRDGMWRGEAQLTRPPELPCPVALVIVGLPPGPDGKTGLALVARDISDRQELAQSLAQEQQLLRALLDNAPDNIYFKDADSRFLRVSKAMAKFMGHSDPAELVGKCDFDFFTAEHAQPALDDERYIIRTGHPIIGIEEKETWPDGRTTWVSTSKMPLHDRDDRVIGTFGISRDITARKLTEQRLAVAQKELLEASRLAGMAEIASGVLHNIGNALNSVNTSVALLGEQLQRSRLSNLGKAAQLLEQHREDLAAFLTESPQGRQLPDYLVQLSALLTNERDTLQRELELLRKNLDHIKEVVAMQQSYARVSSTVEDVAPAELVDEALRISEASLSRHHIAVQRDFQTVPLVRVTRHKVLLILVNLIRNAKHAMDETGRTDKEMVITLRATPAGQVQIIVHDNGVGIPAENLTKIYTFGFTTRKGGHGFGLHSSANAAQELGGSLRGESPGVGQGATFTLELPPVPTTAGNKPA